MSLVGPRPETPSEFVPDLGSEPLPAYRQRLNVRPGVTGLAQVQLPPDTDIESVRRKLASHLTMYYVRRLSPWMDLRPAGLHAQFYAAGHCRSGVIGTGSWACPPSWHGDREADARDAVPRLSSPERRVSA